MQWKLLVSNEMALWEIRFTNWPSVIVEESTSYANIAYVKIEVIIFFFFLSFICVFFFIICTSYLRNLLIFGTFVLEIKFSIKLSKRLIGF